MSNIGDQVKHLNIEILAELERLDEKSKEFSTARNQIISRIIAKEDVTYDYDSLLSIDEVTHNERTRIEKLNLPYEELLTLAANSSALMAFFEFAYEGSKEYSKRMEDFVEFYKSLNEELQFKLYAVDGLGQLMLAKQSFNATLKDKIVLYKVTQQKRNAVNIRHSKPDGSRAKAQAIRDIWATGKYTSRDICAEQECANLNISFSTARKALRNTPEPT